MLRPANNLRFSLIGENFVGKNMQWSQTQNKTCSFNL